MLRVARPDERLAALTKPALQPTKRFTLNAEDCLVACARFEDRALGVLRSVAATETKFTGLILDYRPLVAENRLEEIRSLCRAAKLRTVELTYDRQDPAGFGSTLTDKTAGVRGRVFLD